MTYHHLPGCTKHAPYPVVDCPDCRNPPVPTAPPTRYVLGFAMDRDYVLLLRKARPAWQAGLLNGVGGKVEAYDTSISDAMSREFAEETGADAYPEKWSHFHTELFTNGAQLYCFAAHVPTAMLMDIEKHTARREEPCTVHNVHNIVNAAVPYFIKNIPYLLLMARHWLDRTHDDMLPVPYMPVGATL